MKFSMITRFAMGLLILAAHISPAEVVAPIGNGRLLVPSAPGDYKFTDYDQGRLQKTYLDEVFKRSEADKKYFQDTINDIRSDFSKLLSETMYSVGQLQAANQANTAARIVRPGGLRWMSSMSQAGNYFGASDFMLAVNRYYEAKQQLETKIVALTSMAEKGVLPSQEIRADGSGLKQIDRYGNVDFSEIKNHFAEELVKIDAFANNLPFRLILANRKPVLVAGGEGTSLMIPQAGTLLTEAEMEDLERQIAEALTWSDPDQRDDVDGFTLQVKRTLQGFVETYGSSERWRSISAVEQQKRAEDWQELARAFFLRSYLRTMYKMPIGAIGIDYSKMPFGLERFVGRTHDILTFRGEIMWSEEDFIRGEQDYRNALLRAEERSADVKLGDLKWDEATKILEGDITFLIKGRNLMTWLSGQRNLAEAVRMVIRLLAADFYEERLIQRPLGSVEMLTRFRARYMSSDEDRAFYESLAKAADPARAVAGSNFNANSVLGKFRVVARHMRSKRTERMNAEVLQATLDASRGGSKFTREIEDEQDALFGTIR